MRLAKWTRATKLSKYLKIATVASIVYQFWYFSHMGQNFVGDGTIGATFYPTKSQESDFFTKSYNKLAKLGDDSYINMKL